jgi:hypothetical protein
MGRAIDNPDLPAHYYAALYREFAADSEKCADESHSLSVRTSYLDLAAQWRDLADQIDGGTSSAIDGKRAPIVCQRLEH